MVVIKKHGCYKGSNKISVHIEVLTAVLIKFLVLWDRTPCCLANSDKHVGGICFFHL
jgi:hypothetical protein